MKSKTHWLFICSRNQWRSPTAEAIFRDRPGLEVRSAGTSPKARRRVSEQDLLWADTVYVMEKRHKQQLRERFGSLLDELSIVNLDIPDDYQFMDAELVEILKQSVDNDH